MVEKKEENKDEKEKPVNRIIYFGADTSFFGNIKEKFKEAYPTIDVKFNHFNSEDDKVIQSYILKISEMRPKIVLIDYSKNERAMLHLTRVWIRQNFFTKIHIIGLCDYKQSKSIVVKAIMTTIPSIHIKSLEYESIVHTIAVLAYPAEVHDHGFATAELNDQIHAYHPCKLSLINTNFIRIESSVPMTNKQVVRLGNFWQRKNILNSTLMMCVDQTQENIYYNHKYSQVLQMAHAEPVERTDNMSQDDFEIRQTKRQETVEQSRRNLGKWVRDNQTNSRPKFLKAYVIDKSSSFYDSKPLSDTHQFVYRVQPFIANAKKEITNIMPHLIIFNIEEVDKEVLEANADIAHTFNDSRMLQHLIKTVREICKSKPPIIIVFNAGEHDSAYMQKVLNYPSILAVKEPISLEMTLKMSNMLKAKIEPTLPQPKVGDVYIDKNTELSYAEIESDITLLACSENDIYFDSGETLAMGGIIRVSLPVPMYVTVLPIPEYSKLSSQYYGIIHGIGEGERKELRRFINTIFFRGLEGEKAANRDEIAHIKEEYVKKQEQEEKERIEKEMSIAEKEEKAKKADEELADQAKNIIEGLE